MYSESYKRDYFPDDQKQPNNKRSTKICLCYCCLCFVTILIIILLVSYLIFNLVIDGIIEQKVFESFKIQQDNDAAKIRQRVLDGEKDLVSKDVGSSEHSTYKKPMTQSLYVIQDEKDKNNQIFMQCYWNKQTTNESSLILVSAPIQTSIPKLGDKALTNIAFSFGQNTCFYDYPGNGYSAGKPSEKSMYESLNQVFTKLTAKTNKDGMNIDKRKIILFGHSIGATVSVNFASNQRGLGGLILVTPFTSVFAIAKNINVMPKPLEFISSDSPLMKHRDIFRSDDKIGKISDAPVLVLRGKHDKDVPQDHAETLAKKLTEEAKNDKVTLTEVDTRLDYTFDEETWKLLMIEIAKFLKAYG